MNTVTEMSIMIVNSKDQRGYKTTRGFVPFGGVFIDWYNLSNKGCCDVQDIANYIERDILTDTLREKIVNGSKPLPFRVRLYNEQPVLYFTGAESDLMLYDVLMIKENDIKIKFCKDCGNAFFPKTQGRYCPCCKGPNIRNREKYRALKQDPVRLKYTRLQQRIQKREKASNYKLLFERLAQKNKNVKWLERWSELDKKYQKLKQYSCEYVVGMNEVKWDEILCSDRIESIDDFEKWLKQRQAALPKLWV